MKNLLLLFIFLSAGDECNKESTLPYLSATSQIWVGGAAATRGTYYNIYLGMSKNTDYIFDSLWVDNKRFPVAIKRNANDTLQLFVNDAQGFRNPINKTDFPPVVEEKFPIDVSAEGVVGYFYRGNRKYFAIPSFTKLKTLYYQ